MRRFHLFENFKIFISTQPPAVIFLICLLSFIVVLSSFAGYINDHNIYNPDETDYNTFRERIASLEYCVKYPDDNKNILNNNKNNKISNINLDLETIQYDLTFNIIYNNANRSNLFNLNLLTGKIDGFLIGLDKVDLDFRLDINDVSLNNEECVNKITCKSFLINGCATLQSSTKKIFPKTKSPKTCSKKNNLKNIKQIKTQLTAYQETPDLTTQYWCPSSFGAKTIIKTNNNPSLNAFLTKKDKVIINYNLEFIILCLCILFTALLVNGTVKAAKMRSQYYAQIYDM